MRLVSGGLREKVLPAWVVCFLAVIIFSLLASNGLIWVFFAVRESFVRVGDCVGACGESFVPVSVPSVASVWWSAG